jgi:hypothetical protein
MSSKKTRTQRRRKDLRTEFISAWNVEGALDKPKRHDQKLKVAMVHSECRLVHIIRVDTHLMISGAKVQLCEIAGTMELVK